MRSRAVVYLTFFICLALLLSLGGWQWRRGVEKAAIERLLASEQNHYTTIDRAPQNWADLAYRRVRLDGDWLTGAVFLMANRSHRGRPGYEVFSPYRLAGDDATLLVNRGWIDPATASASDALATGLHHQAEVRGQLYLPQKGFTLGPAYIDSPSDSPNARPKWPMVIQYFDAPALSAALGAPLTPAVVVLESSHPGAFEPNWHARAFHSARHFGYAAQWWGLAATLIVFGFIWRRQATRATRRAGRAVREARE